MGGGGSGNGGDDGIERLREGAGHDMLGMVGSDGTFKIHDVV